MSVGTGPYKPSPWGLLFHSLPYDEVLGAGAAGPGKSWVLLMDPWVQIGVEHQRQNDPVKYPRGHPYWKPRGSSIGWAIHLRRTFPRLQQTIARSHTVFPIIDPGARWYASDHKWVMSSGYTFQFGHCESESAWAQYMGQEYTHEAFDELIEFEEEQYDQISMRLRTGDPVLVQMLRNRSASNPCMTQFQGDAVATKNPHWVRDRFVAPCPEGKRVLKTPVYNPDGSLRKYATRFYLPANIEDNPDPVVREEYKTRLLSAKPHIRRALYDGDWFATAGSFYGEEWNRRLHVVEPFEVPDTWALSRSMDWGFKNPGVVHWWAQDEDDNLYCVREMRFQGKTATEVAHMVREVEESRQLRCWRDGQSQITGPADTQLWEKRGEDARSKAEEFADAGVSWVPAAKASRKRNAELLSARLRDHQSGTTTPGIVFFRTCPWVIQIIPQIQTDKDDINSPADGGDDHPHDSVLYECAFVSRGVRGTARVDMEDRNEGDDEERDKLETHRGAYGYG